VSWLPTTQTWRFKPNGNHIGYYHSQAAALDAAAVYWSARGAKLHCVPDEVLRLRNAGVMILLQIIAMV
jgi:hypothetical protein